MGDNNHTQATPAETLAQVQTKIEEALALLRPFAVNISTDERGRMIHLGEKSLAFVEKAHDFASHNPGLVPAYLNMAAFDADFADAHGYWTVLNTVHQLELMLDNIETAAGSEAYKAALAFYNYTHDAAKQGIAGAEVIYDDLKTHFLRSRHKNGDSETETETLTETVKKSVKVN